MKSPYYPPKGMRDYLPEDFYVRKKLASDVLAVLRQYGYQEVITPGVENLEVFTAKSGNAVTEQIYYFQDKSGRDLALKSDMTPAIARIVAANGKAMQKPIRFAVYDRVYRYERPQHGRYREFYQINAEQFGASGEDVDAEVIACFCKCFDALDLSGVQMRIGHRRVLEEFIISLGVSKESVIDVVRVVDKRAKITDAQYTRELRLAGVPDGGIDNLESFSQSAVGPVQIVLPRFMEKYKHIPGIAEPLKSLERVFQMLGVYKQVDKCVLDLGLARGFDYYTGLLYECEFPNELGIGAIGGGGRYDNLVEVYGGEPTPATGFSIGFDRVISLLEGLGKLNKSSFVPTTDFFVVVIDDSYSKAIEIAENLRENNWIVEVGTPMRSVTKQLQTANRFRSKYAVFVGPEEISTGYLRLKNLQSGQETALTMKDLTPEALVDMADAANAP
ncbi:histidine--tRNA ligase [bacterium]|nr:histidine--tRNA ligase [bacterium]